MKDYSLKINGHNYNVQIDDVNEASTVAHVVVNGVDYEVEIEGAKASTVSKPQVSPAPKSANSAMITPSTATPSPRIAPAPSTSGSSVKCPLPGTVLSVKVAVGDTVADTQKAYEALLATNGVVAEGEGGATDVVTVKGTIRSMNQAVIEGNTHFYLTVEGEDGSIFDFALPGLLDIVGYKVGDEISFTYVEAAGSNVSPAYEILGEGGKASENASGEPEDDVVQQNGAAQTPADVASGEDTEKVA